MFSIVFREYRKRATAWNGLITLTWPKQNIKVTKVKTEQIKKEFENVKWLKRKLYYKKNHNL